MIVRVLVIFEEIPEDTFFYHVDVEHDELMLLKRCHGNFVNTTGLTPEAEEALDWLAKFLENKPKLAYAKGDPFPVTGRVDWVVHTGFML